MLVLKKNEVEVMNSMNEELIKNADACYRLAEQKAAHYFKSLNVQVVQKTYVPTLTKDIQSWKHNHIHHHSLLSFFSRGKRKPDSQGISQLYPMAGLHRQTR